MERVLGFSPSVLDGTEQEFTPVSWDLPEEYDYRPFLPKVLDQGSTNMCVTYSISAHLDWNYNVDHATDNTNDNDIDRHELYSFRSISGDRGMTFKEALTTLRNKGVNSSHGKLQIEEYAMIKSSEALKQALLLNGPCVGGMYVYDMSSSEFWNGSGHCLGGHAIAIVGYNKDGFIIRNSWGTNWGNEGYSILKYKDFNKLLECWTIVD